MEQWVVGEKAGIARTADFVLDKTTESAGIATGLGQYQVRQSLSRWSSVFSPRIRRLRLPSLESRAASPPRRGAYYRPTDFD